MVNVVLKMAYRRKWMVTAPSGRGKLYYNYRPHRYIKTYKSKRVKKFRRPGWSRGQRRTFFNSAGYRQRRNIKSYHRSAKSSTTFVPYASSARRRLEF